MNLSNAKVGDELLIEYGGYHGKQAIRKVVAVNKRFVKDEKGTEWTLRYGHQKGVSGGYTGPRASLIDTDEARERAHYAVEQTNLRQMLNQIDTWVTHTQRSRPFSSEVAAIIRAAYAAVQTSKVQP